MELSNQMCSSMNFVDHIRYSDWYFIVCAAMARIKNIFQNLWQLMLKSLNMISNFKFICSTLASRINRCILILDNKIPFVKYTCQKISTHWIVFNTSKMFAHFSKIIRLFASNWLLPKRTCGFRFVISLVIRCSYWTIAGTRWTRSGLEGS